MDDNKLDELDKLFNMFYQLYGNLFKNRKLLDNNKTYQYFGARIFEQFQIEYQILKIKFETIENPAIYEAYVRHDSLVPRRRFGIFRNSAQKLIDRKVTQELDEYFTKQIAALERLTAALDEADNAEHSLTVFDEPLNDCEEPENAKETQECASDGEQLSSIDNPKESVNNSEPAANVQAIEEQKPKRQRKKRAPEQEKQPQNAVQLQGQIGIEELNESAEPKPENADKPEQ